MKTVIPIILIVLFVLAFGYFGIPIFVDRETVQLRADILELKQEVQKIEEFIRGEEEARNTTQLTPDADLQKVIRTVNAFASRVVELEDDVKKNISQIEGTLSKLQDNSEAAARKNAERIDSIQKETKLLAQRITFDAAMANIRVHVLKVRGDLLYKNIGTAKAELSLISDALNAIKQTAPEENKETIEEFQRMLKSTRDEVESDLPSAMNKIDLLWHEMVKLLKKS